MVAKSIINLMECIFLQIKSLLFVYVNLETVNPFCWVAVTAYLLQNWKYLLANPRYNNEIAAIYQDQEARWLPYKRKPLVYVLRIVPTHLKQLKVEIVCKPYSLESLTVIGHIYSALLHY